LVDPTGEGIANGAWRIAVLGPGAIGGFLAGLFGYHGHRVICVCRKATAETLRRDGLRIEGTSREPILTRPRAVERLDEPVDVLFVTTKGAQLDDAMSRIPVELVANATIVPLLNGFEHMKKLRDRYGKRVVAAMISIESRCESAGVVRQVSPHAAIELAACGQAVGAPTPEDIRGLIEGAGLRCRADRGEWEVIWEKLARLAAIAATTAVTNRSIGEVLAHPRWMSWLEECTKETTAVARTFGVSISSSEVMAKIRTLPVGLCTSLQNDLHGGRETEVEQVLGAVIRAGERAGVTCSRLAAIRKQILAIESSNRSEVS